MSEFTFFLIYLVVYTIIWVYSQWYVSKIKYNDGYNEGYLDGSHSEQEQIEKLEKENQKLRSLMRELYDEKN